MRPTHQFLLLAALLAACGKPALVQREAGRPGAPELPPAGSVLSALRRANQYFMEQWPDPGRVIVTDRARPSNIWTRAVYYEGLMALHRVDPEPAYYGYAVAWGEFHRWDLRDGDTYTRNADDQAAGQTYLELYQLDPRPERMRAIKASLDSMLATPAVDDWSWIDAIQMAMPAFAKLGVIQGDERYFQRMSELYRFTRDRHGEHGLFNPADGLWWRDADFDPPHTSPAGRNVYWSRGNGWVLMALARVLDVIPETAPGRDLYLRDFRAMAAALAPLQRADGFWNVSLHDGAHFGGPETSGTAMFAFGLAWGINRGLLDRPTYLPVVARAWHALSSALRPDGSLGYVQRTGKQPSDGQPVTYLSVPDFEDYALGAFLLAGTEIYLLAGGWAAAPARVERLDPALDELVPRGVQLERLAGGLDWSEGPAWRRSGGYLLFSDIPRNTIYRWQEGAGLSVFLRPAGYNGDDPAGAELGTNGLVFDAGDRLVMADHGNRQIARLDESDFTRTTLADRFEGRRLNSPNDLVIHSRGDIYFTDPPYGLRGLNRSPVKELDFNGVYRLTPAGELTLVTRALTFPNGIGLSPDERTLYVAVSDPANPVWMAYDVAPDGTVSGGRVFFDGAPLLRQGKTGVPDGLTVDARGNLFATGPGGVLVISPEGKHLGTILTGQATANAVFGDDGTSLYITADMDLLRVRLTTRGPGF